VNVDDVLLVGAEENRVGFEAGRCQLVEITQYLGDPCFVPDRGW
jgi:hypothetical protein